MDQEISQAEAIRLFFKQAFMDHKGIVCIGHRERGIDKFNEHFYEYPQQEHEMSADCLEMSLSGDVYFCTQLLKARRRKKEDVVLCPNLWADLDTCSPSACTPIPTVTLETSPGRYHGLWCLQRPLDPDTAEALSKRLAYSLVEHGCDKGGWPLTKYLRIPYTQNYKYASQTGFSPTVRLHSVGQIYELSDFDDLPLIEDTIEASFPFPEELLDFGTLMTYRRSDLNDAIMSLLMDEPPDNKWSDHLWALELQLFEAGFTKEEVFCLASHSACNKYKRDGRSEHELWREVCKAYLQVSTPQVDFVGEEDLFDPELFVLTEEERAWVVANPTIVEEYVNWASTLSDAAWQYHEAGIFVILSALLCGYIRLPTSAATLNLNLWFMLLGNTTLTRKTTSMGIAMSILEEIDGDAMLATDGSIEGLFTGLAARPGRASIFLRDEISGLLEQMQKGDYRAGLGEAFAKLYDGNREKRILRRDVIEVKDPRLILYTGGVKNKVYELLDQAHVLTGFLPRFIFVTAEPKMGGMKPMGPPKEHDIVRRSKILDELQAIYDFYRNQKLTISVNGQGVGNQKKIQNASLTDEAWDRFNRFADSLLREAMQSIYQDSLIPTYDRLTKSALKVATLIAATRREEQVLVTEGDIVRAFFYIERWKKFAFEVVTNLGKNSFEQVLDKVLGYIMREPGITRSKLMRVCSLTNRTAAEVFDTLSQRGIIRRETTRAGKGKAERFYMIGKLEQEAIRIAEFESEFV